MTHILLPFVQWNDVGLVHHEFGKVAHIQRLAAHLLMQSAQLGSSEFGRHHLEEHLWLLASHAVELVERILDYLVVVEGKRRKILHGLPQLRIVVLGTSRAAIDAHQRQIGDGDDATDLLLDGIFKPKHVLRIRST